MNKCSPVESECSTSSLHKSVRNNTVQTTSAGSWETADTEAEVDPGFGYGTIRFFSFELELLLTAVIIRRVWNRIKAVVDDNYLNRQCGQNMAL